MKCTEYEHRMRVETELADQPPTCCGSNGESFPTPQSNEKNNNKY